MLHLYESLFRAGYGEHPERFLSKDELDDYRASLPITIHSILNCSPCLTPNSPFSSKNYRTIALTLSVLSATLLFAAACVSA